MRKLIKISYFAIILFFMYCPIFIMMIFSFNKGTTITVFRGWSFKWYEVMTQYTAFTSSIIVSLFVGAFSTIISLLIGIPACCGLLNMSKRKQKKWNIIINMPLINADIITAVSLLVCFTMMGLNLGILTLIAAHVSFNVPFVIITILPFMSKINKEYYNASADLGAGPIKTFFKIIIPNLYPSIIGAAVLSFSMSFDDFIISYFTSGSVTNVSTFIYSAQRIQPYINAFGTLLVCVIAVSVIIYNIYILINKKIKLDNENIIVGTFATNREKKIYKKLADLYNTLNNKIITRNSINPIRYIKYKYYYYLYKFYSSKNVEIKIFRLIAKREKILEDIKWEKRTYFRYERYTKVLTNLLENNVSENDKTKYKKHNSLINKAKARINKLESDIEWIEKRNDSVNERIAELNDEINNIKEDLQDNRIKKTKANRLIKQYTKELVYLQEGPNIYKLKMNIDRQKEIVEKDRLNVERAYWKLRNSRNELVIKANISKRIDNKLLKIELTKRSELYEILLLKKTKFIEDFKERVRYKILILEKKIDLFNDKIASKRNKLLGIKYNELGQINEDFVYQKGKGLKYKNTLTGLFLTLILVCSTCLFTYLYIRQGSYDLIMANWGSYINQQVIKNFEKKYDVKIGYQEYDSNETLYGKQQYYNYDIMVPSDYMVQKLAIENRIKKIDWSRLTNAKYSSKLKPLNTGEDPSKFFDPKIGQDVFDDTIYNLNIKSVFNGVNNNKEDISDYCLPYLWGNVEILFNIANKNVREFISSENIKFNAKKSNMIDSDTLGWESLWDAADKGLRVNLNFDSKNLFMYSLEKNYGVSSPKIDNNEKNNITIDDMIHNTYNDLSHLIIDHKSNVKLLDDQLIDNAVGNQFDIAVMYNGDISYAYSDGEHKFAFGIPGKKALIFKDKLQNTNVWTDNIVIGKNNKNIDLTYKLLNFMYQQDSQKLNTDELSITSPLKNFNDNYSKNMSVQQQNVYRFYDLLQKNGDSNNDPNKHIPQSFQYNKDTDQKLEESYTKLISQFQ
ncbi:ABC transporter permease subunit [Spiroplasma endosymbiont of Aspidapion aeneum]|uniref:ABC transporter permease subunit n=1 Tax=Spiroplasma endosymbiont of Aspidapion aeneum TaxID=3066276 RepID=UPI00313B7F08